MELMDGTRLRVAGAPWQHATGRRKPRVESRLPPRTTARAMKRLPLALAILTATLALTACCCPYYPACDCPAKKTFDAGAKPQ